MQFKSFLLSMFTVVLFSTATIAQTLPAQTDVYNISLQKFENITKSPLKDKLRELQTSTDSQLSEEQLLLKYFLEVSVGDEYLGLQQLKRLAEENSHSYIVWNTLAWANFISGKYNEAETAIQNAIAIHPSQFLGADHLFVKMIHSANGAIPTKEITPIKNDIFDDFLLLQTVPTNTDTLLSQINYLLTNQFSFGNPKDSITAQLLIDAGDLIAKKEDRNKGISFYKLALQQDSSFQTAVQTRIDVIEEGKKTVKDTFSWASIIWAIPLIALAFIGAATLKSYKKD